MLLCGMFAGNGIDMVRFLWNRKQGLYAHAVFSGIVMIHINILRERLSNAFSIMQQIFIRRM